MNGAVSSQGGNIAAAYLQHLQMLASEIQTAINAIATNSLPELNESIARQEMVAASLVVLAKNMGAELMPAEESLPGCVDEDIAPRIRIAGTALRNLNLQYASLLKYSGRSIALLSSLCKSHLGQFTEARGSRSKHQTWSCEM